jgi:hypothetical protein
MSPSPSNPEHLMEICLRFWQEMNANNHEITSTEQSPDFFIFGKIREAYNNSDYIMRKACQIFFCCDC